MPRTTTFGKIHEFSVYHGLAGRYARCSCGWIGRRVQGGEGLKDGGLVSGNVEKDWEEHVREERGRELQRG